MSDTAAKQSEAVSNEKLQFLTLEQIKEESLKLLCAFDGFCKDHDLRYSLAGGTMLGAARHKGFIPWDDDIDVMMPRPDYERFRGLSDAIEKELGLRLQGYPDSKAAIPAFVMLANPEIKVKPHYRRETFNLGIDVLPMDGLPDDEDASAALLEKVCRARRPVIVSYADPKEGKTAARKLIKSAFSILNSVFRVGPYFEKRLRNLAESYDYSTSNYVAVISWGLYGAGERMKKEDFERLIEVEFEGCTFKAMSCYDEYLSGIYGSDYMELPPEEKRVSHSLAAWFDGENSNCEKD